MPVKVSVIIPCYNREAFIAQTLESVLAQSYPNIELIVVDDGCTDGSRAILEEYADRLLLLEHPGRVNRGQSAAINLGLRRASGDYIAVLDSDDLFAPTKIERQVSYLEEHPEVGLVYCNGQAIAADGRPLYRIYSDRHQERSDPNLVLMDCYFSFPSNSLVRRSVIEAAGELDESLRSGQDHDMAIRIAEVTRLGYLNEELFYYRRHADSISHTQAKLRWNNGLKILRKAVKRYPYSLDTRRRRFAVLSFRIGQCYWEENSYLRALACFVAAGVCDPWRSLRVLAGRESVAGLH